MRNKGMKDDLRPRYHRSRADDLFKLATNWNLRTLVMYHFPYDGYCKGVPIAQPIFRCS